MINNISAVLNEKCLMNTVLKKGQNFNRNITSKWSIFKNFRTCSSQASLVDKTCEQSIPAPIKWRSLSKWSIYVMPTDYEESRKI